MLCHGIERCTCCVMRLLQPIAFGVSSNLNLQFQSPISISLVSFQRNVAKEAQRTRTSIEIWDWRNDTRNAIGCSMIGLLNCSYDTSRICTHMIIAYTHMRDICVCFDRSSDDSI